MQQEDQEDPMIVDAIPITLSKLERSIRESWRNQKVLLKDETVMHIVNKKFILYVFPHECVNFQQLNDDFVGVGVERANASTSFDALLEVGSITLVRWPIDQITMLNGRPLQCYVPLNNMQGE